jgi:hypothetical protein
MNILLEHILAKKNPGETWSKIYLGQDLDLVPNVFKVRSSKNRPE